MLLTISVKPLVMSCLGLPFPLEFECKFRSRESLLKITLDYQFNYFYGADTQYIRYNGDGQSPNFKF